MAFVRLIVVCGCVCILAARSVADGAVTEEISDFSASTFKITDQGAIQGTCFLISASAAGSLSSNVLFLVTAAHAFEQASNRQQFYVIMPETNADKSVARKEVALPIRNAGRPLWVRHPKADIAAIKVNLPTNASVRPFRLDRLANEADFTNGQIRLGNETWMYSFPVGMEANQRGQPILRRGSLASLPSSPPAPDESFMVDMTLFKGDSGAALLAAGQNDINPGFRIIGILVGMHLETDTTTTPFEERTVHHAMNLGVVIHSKFIKETVELLLK